MKSSEPDHVFAHPHGFLFIRSPALAVDIEAYVPQRRIFWIRESPMSFFRSNREKTSVSEVPTNGVIMEAENMVEGAIRRCRGYPAYRSFRCDELAGSTRYRHRIHVPDQSDQVDFYHPSLDGLISFIILLG